MKWSTSARVDFFLLERQTRACSWRVRIRGVGPVDAIPRAAVFAGASIYMCTSKLCIYYSNIYRVNPAFLSLYKCVQVYVYRL